MKPRRISSTPEQAKLQQIHYGTGEAMHYYDHWIQEEGPDRIIVHYFIYNPESCKEKGYLNHIEPFINDEITGNWLIDPVTKQRWIWMAYPDKHVYADDPNPPYMSYYIACGFFRQATQSTRKIDEFSRRAEILQEQYIQKDADYRQLYERFRTVREDVFNELKELAQIKYDLGQPQPSPDDEGL